MEKFTKKHTNIAKGTAILMVLWHHLFYNTPKYHAQFTSLMVIDGIPLASYISMVLKMTLSIFLILSGYGLSKSYSRNLKNSLRGDVFFVFSHLTNLLLEFWFVYILFVPLGFFFGRSPLQVYRGNIKFFLADFFGLSYLLTGGNSFTMNEAWWYMSLIIIYYLLSPLIFRLLRKWPETFLAVSAAISLFVFRLRYFDCWIFPFVLGAYFANKDLFVKITRGIPDRVNRLLFSVVFILICSFTRLQVGDQFFLYVFDSFFGLGVIFFSFWVLSGIPFFEKVLELFGKYTGTIFMMHPFFYEYYFPKFIYSGKYAPVIFLMLATVCLLTAYLMEKLKHLIGYDKLPSLIRRSA